jgi:hypothetical protein
MSGLRSPSTGNVPAGEQGADRVEDVDRAAEPEGALQRGVVIAGRVVAVVHVQGDVPGIGQLHALARHALPPEVDRRVDAAVGEDDDRERALAPGDVGHPGDRRPSLRS